MDNLLPGSYFNLAYTTQAKVMFFSLVAAGIAIALMVRHHFEAPRRLAFLALGVSLATLSLHLLTAWVLLVAPALDMGHASIPLPWNSLASWLTLMLNLLAPLFLGFAFALLAGAPARRGAAWWGAAIAGYAVWIAPWALFKVFD